MELIKPVLQVDRVKMGDTVEIQLENMTATRRAYLYMYINGQSVAGGGTTNAGEGTYSWRVRDMVAKIPGMKEAVCTVVCRTQEGSKMLDGEETATITVVVPEGSAPTAQYDVLWLGRKNTVFTNRKSSAYTHTLSYEIGGASGVIEEGVTDRCEWTPGWELAAQMAGNPSVCDIVCDTYNGTLLVEQKRVEINLRAHEADATVPEVAVQEADLGSSVTVYLPRKAEAFMHELTYKVTSFDGEQVLGDGFIGNEYDGDFTGDCQWQLPYTMGMFFPNKVRALVTVICNTYVGGESVGTGEVSFAVRVLNNENTRPRATLTVEPGKTPIAGLYLAGKSTVVATCEASSDCSTIKERRIEIDRGHSTDGSMEQFCSAPGELKIYCRVTDARGFYTEVTGTVTVIDYSPPRVIPVEGDNKPVCFRCKGDGSADPAGVYLRVQMGRKYSKVMSNGEQHNFCTLGYQFKEASADAFSDEQALLAVDDGTDYVDVVLNNIEYSYTKAYHVLLVARDTVGNVHTVAVAVPSAFTTYHAPPGGHGFTIGGYHDPNNVDAFVCLFDAQGKLVGLGRLPEMPSQDANECTECGCYAVPGAAVAHTNMPDNLPGTLRVWSADGCGDAGDAEDILYRIQEFIPRSGLVSYRRALQKRVDAETWTFGTWARSQWEEI